MVRAIGHPIVVDAAGYGRPALIAMHRAGVRLRIQRDAVERPCIGDGGVDVVHDDLELYIRDLLDVERVSLRQRGIDSPASIDRYEDRDKTDVRTSRRRKGCSLRRRSSITGMRRPWRTQEMPNSTS